MNSDLLGLHSEFIEFLALLSLKIDHDVEM